MDHITSVYDLANPTGIRSVKFINAKRGLAKVRSGNWRRNFKDRDYDGMTRIGTALKTKILDQFVWREEMKKPLLVMIITDGEVSSWSIPKFYSTVRTKSLLYLRRRVNGEGCWKM